MTEMGGKFITKVSINTECYDRNERKTPTQSIHIWRVMAEMRGKLITVSTNTKRYDRNEKETNQRTHTQSVLAELKGKLLIKVPIHVG